MNDLHASFVVRAAQVLDGHLGCSLILSHHRFPSNTYCLRRVIILMGFVMAIAIVHGEWHRQGVVAQTLPKRASQ
jgi:hypothetical protein